VNEKLIKILATGFFVGYLPIFPGTAGTILAFPIWLSISELGTFPYLLALLLLFFIGAFVSQEAEKIFKERDAPMIVLDEIEGYLVAMFELPKTLFYIVSAFILFRILDIWKFRPIPLTKALPRGGIGVMLDDTLSGILTNVCLHFLRLTFLRQGD
jgi:phosphatidylglycerophosphatase A